MGLLIHVRTQVGVARKEAKFLQYRPPLVPLGAPLSAGTYYPVPTRRPWDEMCRDRDEPGSKFVFPAHSLLLPVCLLRVDLRWVRACWVETLLPRVLAVRQLMRLDGW